MNTLILNGNLHNAALESYLQKYQLNLQHLGHYVKTYHLRNMNISNDGEIRDDFKYITNGLKEVDLLIQASPLINGHTSELSLRVQTRLTVHFKQALQPGWHTLPDYTSINRVPLFGVIFMPEEGYSEHSLLLNKLTQERLATDLHTLLSLFIPTYMPYTEAVCETLKCFHHSEVYDEIAGDYLN